MECLANRMNSFSESKTLEMTKLSRAYAEKGYDVINLSIGEPDFNTPEHIKTGAKESIDNNITHYPPVSGFAKLKEAISEKFKTQNGLDYSPSQIVVSTGAKQALANIMLALLNPGDEVILPAPYWVSYAQIVRLAEGNINVLPTSIENDFKITPQQLSDAINERSKIFLICSPSNPTGSVYSKTELKEFADILADKKDIYIVTDEIYEHINYTGKHESIGQFESIKDRVITVNGFSKAFAMTGWRIGYMGAPEKIAKACEKLQGQFTSGASSISQMAALTALNSNLDKTKEMVEEFRKRRDLISSLMKKIPGVKTNIPEGAFYLFPDISYYFGKTDGDTIINNADDFCTYLMKDVYVTLVTGTAFGDEKCVRLSFAASEERITEAIKRIGESLSKLK